MHASRSDNKFDKQLLGFSFVDPQHSRIVLGGGAKKLFMMDV
jgi:hypothetical protein